MESKETKVAYDGVRYIEVVVPTDYGDELTIRCDFSGTETWESAACNFVKRVFGVYGSIDTRLPNNENLPDMIRYRMRRIKLPSREHVVSNDLTTDTFAVAALASNANQV